MDTFDEVIGHSDIKRYFERALKYEKVAHSYIFEGIEGVGKKTVAKIVAKTLLCQEENKPCGQCKSCIMIEANTHPDYKLINKDTKVTKIDTIREQVVKSMEIKPQYGPYKIIVITEADTVTTEGQNAMLKTIEEPPLYGIVIFITKNFNKLLATIKSRCIHLRFNALNQNEMMYYLHKKQLTDHEKQIFSQFSEGSIGIANQLMEDEAFQKQRIRSVELLKEIENANLIEVYKIIKNLTDAKEELTQILDFWLLWYRDLAIIKVGEEKILYFIDYQSSLLDTSSKLTYNIICKHIDLIKNTKLLIEQNINSTLAMESLLLKLKEKKK